MSDRIEIFKQMLEADPENTMVLFGLANEYLKAGNYPDGIGTLEEYLGKADDEGAAYGMLARAYEKTGQSAKAKAAFEKGVEVALANGHPSMAEEYRETLELDYQ
ncbi:MAG: tetratricopeptide repeat protein [Pyrinomonadaceae bacterium]